MIEQSTTFSPRQIKGFLGPGGNSPTVFLETGLVDQNNNRSFLFTDFSQILIFDCDSSPDDFFNQVEQYLAQGYWLAGYFTYEFGYFLEGALTGFKPKTKEPLAWLGVCKNPRVFRHDHHCLASQDYLEVPAISNIRYTIDRNQYDQKIERIKWYLKEGLSYQVNYTFKANFDYHGSAVDLYLALRRRQPTAYSAFLNTGTEQIVSLSPELFFRVDNKRIVSKPMKGTAPRGADYHSDQKNKSELKCAKAQAENVMIVDLLRNDLGRIASEISVPRLFEVEEYPTLYQMTSTIIVDGAGNG